MSGFHPKPTPGRRAERFAFGQLLANKGLLQRAELGCPHSRARSVTAPGFETPVSIAISEIVLSAVKVMRALAATPLRPSSLPSDLLRQ